MSSNEQRRYNCAKIEEKKNANFIWKYDVVLLSSHSFPFLALDLSLFHTFERVVVNL